MTQIRLDTKILDQMERQSSGRAHQIVGKIANDMVADIITHFTTSPSAPGEPPGVLTGNLKNNIRAEPVSERVWRVIAGTEYAAYLEFGTVRMAARPFMQPSAERIAKMLPAQFGALVQP